MNGQPSQQSPEDGTCTALAEQDFTAESFSKTLHKSIPAVEISHSTGSKAYSSQMMGFPRQQQLRDGCTLRIVLWVISQVALSPFQVISQHLSWRLLLSLLHVFVTAEDEECSLSAS